MRVESETLAYCDKLKESSFNLIQNGAEIWFWKMKFTMSKLTSHVSLDSDQDEIWIWNGLSTSENETDGPILQI